jgi:phosphatidylserine decarboxylase
MHIGISRHGFPFLFLSLILLILTTIFTTNWPKWLRYPVVSSPILLLAMFITFFRDPERSPPGEEGLILAPADGKIIRVSEEVEDSLPGGRCILISIFMSIWNVHINRIPVSGEVIRREYRAGKFLPAYRDEASRRNEQCSLVIEHEDKTVILRQVAGILARRIITYPKEGDHVKRGERLGMVLFGSRLDLFIPMECKVKISCGEKTVAGKTIIGVFS